MRPCSTSISKGALISISQNLTVNKEYNNIRIWKNKKVGRFYLAKNAKLFVDSCTMYSGITLSVNEDAVLSLGKCFFNYDCRISCYNSISIGDGVVIADNVTIRDSDNHIIIREGYVQSAPIVIEDNVWIGVNSTILKGVRIGEGSVVAAGAVVTKSCPPILS